MEKGNLKRESKTKAEGTTVNSKLGIAGLRHECESHCGQQKVDKKLFHYCKVA